MLEKLSQIWPPDIKLQLNMKDGIAGLKKRFESPYKKSLRHRRRYLVSEITRKERTIKTLKNELREVNKELN